MMNTRQVRNLLINEIVDFNKKIREIMSILAGDKSEQIDNVLVAQLNDVAYKTIKHGGV